MINIKPRHGLTLFEVPSLRASLTPWVLFVFILLLTFVPSYAHAAKPLDRTDIHVDHVIQVRDGGLVIVNDTIRLSTEPTVRVEPIQNFSVGFPFQYGFNLVYCFAYETSNPDVELNVELDVGLGRLGFYGVNVLFPEPIDVSNGASYSFTLVFVFSDMVSSETKESFRLNFPMYPSLTMEASTCMVKVVLPQDADFVNSSFPVTELDFNITEFDSYKALSHIRSPLKDFTYEPAWLVFNTTTTFRIIRVEELNREVTLSEWGWVFLSDSYRITNKAEVSLSELKIQLPEGAHSVSARDPVGELSMTLEEGNTTSPTNATISFRSPLGENETGMFTVAYMLPWEGYVTQRGWNSFNLTLPTPEILGGLVEKLTLDVNLPEGAEVQSSSINPYSLHRDVFREKISFMFHKVTLFHTFNSSITYNYPIFWASFRPTLWVGVLLAIICVVFLFWRAPRLAVPVVPTPVPVEELKSFVDTYEEKRRALSELEAIERAMRRRKIPRRRYKVRRRTLESQLSSLSRTLSELREKLQKASPTYADLMRQIEVAETELESVKVDERRVRLRYQRGEISAGAYRKLLDEYRRRKDRAKVAIDGALLRLKEELP